MATPHDYLGMHPCRQDGKAGVVVRALLPNVRSCDVVDYQGTPEKRYPLELIDPAGFFEGFIPARETVFAYRLRVEKTNGEIRQFYDPYCYLPTLSEDDVYLINQGTHHYIHHKLGSHLRTFDGVQGASFAVWAPSAKRVSVVGDFNQWDGRYHPMRMLGSSGIWEIFIPGMEAGTKYKYEILGAGGYLHLKTDPYALYFEPPPHNASIVWDIEGFAWEDQAWLRRREKTDWNKAPVSVYEVHLGSWKRVLEDGGRPLNYRDLASELTDYVKRMGFTHVELMPISEHPFTGSWGYQVTGFYAPTHRYGTPQDFMYLVNALHKEGIGVIMDWVPAHFPRDTFALAEFDGTHLYEHADPRQGEHQDWGTLIFNYGRHEVKGFLMGSALAWMERYHIDGLRVDAVASMLYLDYSRKEGEWIPNQYGGRENIEAIDFLRESNDLVHRYYPGTLMIAEESTSFGGVTSPTKDYGLGYDFKWNMGWMHDSLEYFKKDPIHRRWHHNVLTFPMLFQFSEKFISVYSHDEVVHGKGAMIMKMGSSTISDKARTLRALYAMMWFWPGKKTLFMGSEFGQTTEWRYDGSLDWHLLQYMDHEGIRRIVKDLNHAYVAAPAVAARDNDPAGFQWINCHDADNSVISFLRLDDQGNPVFAVVCSFTPVSRTDYRVGVPLEGFWQECINTNAECYGGSGEGNLGGLMTEAVGCDGRPASLKLCLPPLTTLVFRYHGKTAPKPEAPANGNGRKKKAPANR